MILFLIELFCECTELERSNYVQRCIRKESSFKNSSRCCCTLSYDLTKMNYKDFSAFKKKYVSNLEMLRNSLASLASFCLLVCWYKEGVVFHSVCNYTTGHLFNNKQKTPKKQRKGRQNEMFSVFLHFSLREYLTNLKTILLLCALAQSLTHYYSCSLSCPVSRLLLK